MVREEGHAPYVRMSKQRHACGREVMEGHGRNNPHLVLGDNHQDLWQALEPKQHQLNLVL